MRYTGNKIKSILEKIKTNKRLVYLSLICLLVMFCLVLNVTYGVFSSGYQKGQANIKINDLKYLFAINTDYAEYKSNIIDDRIVKSLPNSTLIFYVDITSQNKYDTKYEVLYNYCGEFDEESNKCTISSEAPSDVYVYYAMDTEYLPEDVILSNETKRVKLVIYNQSSNIYYYELGMNAGYTYNELAHVSSKGKEITDGYAVPDGRVWIVSYVDGVPIPNGIFPTTGYYDVTVTCTLSDGTKDYDMGKARWNGSKWLITITDAPENTYCSADFVENANPYPVFTYIIDGVDYADDTSKVEVVKDGTGSWKIYFYESGTFKTSYPDSNSVDIFLAGGGGGGGSGVVITNGGPGGGAGGVTLTSSNGSIVTNTEYVVTVGAGGELSTAGGDTSFIGGTYELTAAGGTGGGASSYMGAAKGGSGGSGGGGGGGCGLNVGTSTWGGGAGGAGGTNGGNGKNGSTGYSGAGASTGGTGQGTTTREFGESAGTLYSSGGKGGSGCATSLSGSEVTANTGFGGVAGRVGASGVVVIRNVRS